MIIMPSTLTSSIMLYADDAKLYRAISTQTDTRFLQEDIVALEEWSKVWLLRFHPQKCSLLRVGLQKKAKTDYHMHQNGQDISLEWVDSIRDLGVIMDGGLRFQEEIASRTKKANAIVGIIRRTFKHLHIDTFVPLFKSLVRPHLEYGAAVWHPHLRRNIDELEKVQRRATKQVPEVRNLPYELRLERLGLPTLEHRRRRGDLIETFKILRGLYDIDHRVFFHLREDQRTRGNVWKLVKPRTRSPIRSRVFFRKESSMIGMPCQIPLSMHHR